LLHFQYRRKMRSPYFQPRSRICRITDEIGVHFTVMHLEGRTHRVAEELYSGDTRPV
jgi:hypothetical protein